MKLYKTFQKKKVPKEIKKHVNNRFTDLLKRKSVMKSTKNKFEVDIKKMSILRHNSIANSPYFRTDSLNLIQNSILKNDTTDQINEEKITKESRVGKKLSELTTKRVIILVLLLICVIPFFTVNYYYSPNPSFIIWMTIIKNMCNNYKNNDIPLSTIDHTFTEFVKIHSNQKSPLIFANIPLINKTFSINNNYLENFRPAEINIFKDFIYNGQEIISVINEKYTAKQNAGLNIGRTIFVCLLLALGSLFFSKDANELVLNPIERIIEKVEKIAKNPLSSKDVLIENNNYNNNNELQMETLQIENSIIKIGILLALGFGDAGSEIISTNMGSSGDVDPLIPGCKVDAIFGFCDIRNFTNSTEILQEKVMIFVNTIAEIVHKTVDKYGGSANKNIGDAFLIVWKLKKNGLF